MFSDVECLLSPITAFAVTSLGGAAGASGWTKVEAGSISQGSVGKTMLLGEIVGWDSVAGAPDAAVPTSHDVVEADGHNQGNSTQGGNRGPPDETRQRQGCLLRQRQS